MASEREKLIEAVARNMAAGANGEEEKATTELAAKDAEIERWKDQTMEARQLARDEAEMIRNLRAEIAALREALVWIELVALKGGSAPVIDVIELSKATGA